MSLPKLTENLNNISSLPDKPSTTSTELKRLFDKAGNDIKDYINNILNDAIETLITNTVRDNKTVVENVLNSTSIVNALSAAQGKVLKDLCDENKEDIENIEDKTTYSTDEKQIGKWIDGKPIYRKVYENLNVEVPTNTWTNILTVPNIDKIIDIKIYTGAFSTLRNGFFGLDNGSNVTTMINSISSSTMINSAIVEYTKTTD